MSVAFNLRQLALENDSYRKVVCTSSWQQVVLMCLKSGEEIVNHNHDYNEQFMQLEQGLVKVILEYEDGIRDIHIVNKGDAMIISLKVYHHIINIGSESAKISLVYSPPHFSSTTHLSHKPHGCKS